MWLHARRTRRRRLIILRISHLQSTFQLCHSDHHRASPATWILYIIGCGINSNGCRSCNAGEWARNWTIVWLAGPASITNPMWAILTAGGVKCGRLVAKGLPCDNHLRRIRRPVPHRLMRVQYVLLTVFLHRHHRNLYVFNCSILTVFKKIHVGENKKWW